MNEFLNLFYYNLKTNKYNLNIVNKGQPCKIFHTNETYVQLAYIFKDVLQGWMDWENIFFGKG